MPKITKYGGASNAALYPVSVDLPYPHDLPEPALPGHPAPAVVEGGEDGPGSDDGATPAGNGGGPDDAHAVDGDTDVHDGASSGGPSDSETPAGPADAGQDDSGPAGDDTPVKSGRRGRGTGSKTA